LVEHVARIQTRLTRAAFPWEKPEEKKSLRIPW
jgi:hypothetical protein